MVHVIDEECFTSLSWANSYLLDKEVMFSVALVCLFVCLSASTITQKVING